MTRLLIVRHGETQWNVEHRLQGHTDIPLTIAGLQQAQQLAQRLRTETIRHLYSSPLQRALVTAQTVHQHHPLAPLTIVDGLAEHGFGQIEGMFVDSVHARYSNSIWLNDSIRQQVGAVTNREVENFFHSWLPEITYHHPEQTILIATHAGTKKSLLRSLNLKVADRTLIESSHSMPNTALTIVETDGQGHDHMLLFACDAHLHPVVTE